MLYSISASKMALCIDANLFQEYPQKKQRPYDLFSRIKSQKESMLSSLSKSRMSYQRRKTGEKQNRSNTCERKKDLEIERCEYHGYNIFVVNSR
jgi:hypothetical protein